MPRIFSGNAVRLLSVIVAGLLITWLVTIWVKKRVEDEIQKQFAFDTARITSRIEAHMQAQKQVLLGGAALFSASDSVSREEWREYARRVQINNKQFNGILGFGYAQVIFPDKLNSHIESIRRQGFPDYRVWPAGSRDIYTSIIYLEPSSGRNLRAFGYDMFTDPVRRDGMIKSRDQNDAVLTGKVLLVQETNTDVQAGTLMYVPVYRKHMPVGTVLQKRAALQGWVYSPFRMGDLIRGALQDLSNRDQSLIRVRIYDGNTVKPSSELYDGILGGNVKQILPSLFGLDRHISVSERNWTIHFDLIRSGVAGVDYSKAWLTFWMGLLITLLLFLLTRSYLNTRLNAYRIADNLTAELRRRVENEQEMNAQLYLQGAALDSSANSIVILDQQGMIKWANPAFIHLTGYKPSELIGHVPNELADETGEKEEFLKNLWSTIRSGGVWRGELVSQRKDGSTYHEEMTITPVLDLHGDVSNYIAVQQDISDRKAMESALRESEERYRILFEKSKVPMLLIDSQDGKIVDVNEAALKYYGFTEDQFRQLRISDINIIPDEDVRSEMQMAKQGVRSHFFFRHRLANGKVCDVEVHSGPLRIGGRKFLYSLVLDITERREAERLLQLSEARYRTVVDNIKEVIFQTDASGLWTFLNNAWEEVTGFSVDHSIGTLFLNYIHADDRQRNQELFEPLIARQKDYCRHEVRYLTRDGGFRWIEVYARLGLNELDEIVGTYGTLMDITDRKLAEGQLKESEERLELVLSVTGEGIWDWNLVDNRVKHNIAWCSLLGLDASFLEHELRVFTDFIYPEDVERVQAHIRNCIEGNSVYVSEHRMVRKDGQVIWVVDRGNVVERDAEGHALRMVGSFTDVTDRKSAEAALHKAEARMRKILESSPEGVMVIDSGGQITFCNNQLFDLLMLKLACGGNLHVNELGEWFLPGTTNVLDDIIRGETQSGMFDLSDPARVIKWEKKRIDSKELNHIIFFRDVTLEMEVDRMKSEFLATAAHELRTPMASIYGFVELMLYRDVTVTERNEYLTIVYEQAKSLIKMLNELLDLARIEARAGKDFNYAMLDVLDVARKSLLELNVINDDRVVLIEIESDSLPAVMIDPEKIKQIFTNVFSNAYKYSPGGGDIQLSACTVHNDEKDWLRFDIKDQGIGMNPEQQSRIFEKFYRADSSSGIPGTGLGMSLVSEIMQLHGGRVEVRSVLGVGTLVSLWFPIQTAKS